MIIEVEKGNPHNLKSLTTFGARLNNLIPSSFSIPLSLSPKPSHPLFLTPLHLATSKGHSKVVNELILLGADVKVPLFDNRISLDIAAFHGNREIVEALVYHSLNEREKEKMEVKGLVEDILHLGTFMDLETHSTLLHTLVKDTNEEKRDSFAARVELFMGVGERIDGMNRQKMTPIHLAVQLGRFSLVDKLIQSGGKVDSRAKKGFHPIHYAAKEGHVEAINHLLEMGTSIEVENKNGETPL